MRFFNVNLTMKKIKSSILCQTTKYVCSLFLLALCVAKAKLGADVIVATITEWITSHWIRLRSNPLQMY